MLSTLAKVLSPISSSQSPPPSPLYTFIHPTKVGGNAFKAFVNKYYSKYIDVPKGGHKRLCADHPHPIIFLRDPFDRFISMYKYWKYGSVEYRRRPEFIQQNRGTTLKEFIKYVETKDKRLYHDITWEEHFIPQSHWITPENYSKTIVVIYHKDQMDQRIKQLIDYLEIDISHTGPIPTFPKVNVSKGDAEITKENMMLDGEDIEKIHQIYADDFRLFYRLKNQPELFAQVIGKPN